MGIGGTGIEGIMAHGRGSAASREGEVSVTARLSGEGTIGADVFVTGREGASGVELLRA